MVHSIMYVGNKTSNEYTDHGQDSSTIFTERDLGFTCPLDHGSHLQDEAKDHLSSEGTFDSRRREIDVITLRPTSNNSLYSTEKTGRWIIRRWEEG